MYVYAEMFHFIQQEIQMHVHRIEVLNFNMRIYISLHAYREVCE